MTTRAPGHYNGGPSGSALHNPEPPFPLNHAAADRIIPARPALAGPMREPDPTPPSPLSSGVGWASRVTTLGLEFCLPPLAGVWVDNRMGTRPWGLLVGAILGFAVGLTHLVQLARGSTRR